MKVLLVRTDSQLGDTIFETCFYREIKRHFSDAHITVMVCGNRRVLENLPYIDEFIWLPSRGIKRLLYAFLALAHIWQQHFDVLVSLTPTWRMRLFNKLLRAKRKFPFEYRLGVPAVENYKNILTRLGVTDIDSSYTLVIPPDARQTADEFLAGCRLTRGNFLLLNPVASCDSYTLSLQKVTQIIEQLRLTGVTEPIVILDYQNKYKSLQMPGVFRFTSNDVLAVAAVTKHAGYVLTVDTAISHMAYAFSLPMTVLFTDQPKVGLPRAKSLEHLISFAPPSEDVQVLWAPDSVNAISVQDIVAVVSKRFYRRKKSV